MRGVANATSGKQRPQRPGKSKTGRPPAKKGADAHGSSRLGGEKLSIKLSIKKLRQRLGLEARELSLLLGCDKKHVYRWEAGRVAPKGLNRALLDALDRDSSMLSASQAKMWGDAIKQNLREDDPVANLRFVLVMPAYVERMHLELVNNVPVVARVVSDVVRGLAEDASFRDLLVKSLDVGRMIELLAPGKMLTSAPIRKEQPGRATLAGERPATTPQPKRRHRRVVRRPRGTAAAQSMSDDDGGRGP